MAGHGIKHCNARRNHGIDACIWAKNGCGSARACGVRSATFCLSMKRQRIWFESKRGASPCSVLGNTLKTTKHPFDHARTCARLFFFFFFFLRFFFFFVLPPFIGVYTPLILFMGINNYLKQGKPNQTQKTCHKQKFVENETPTRAVCYY